MIKACNVFVHSCLCFQPSRMPLTPYTRLFVHHGVRFQNFASVPPATSYPQPRIRISTQQVTPITFFLIFSMLVIQKNQCLGLSEEIKVASRAGSSWRAEVSGSVGGLRFTFLDFFAGSASLAFIGILANSLYLIVILNSRSGFVSFAKGHRLERTLRI
jgi:hypothetical protein